MELVEPKAVIVSVGKGFHDEFYHWLIENKIDWRPDKYGVSFLESLYEFAGRLCYESWKVEGEFKNKNISKIREGNETYLKNILEVKHGSVLEHGGIVILFNNVSRVFTHELVRHRVGVAMSQTSGRYVRLDNIKFWIPPSLSKDIIVSNTIEAFITEIEKAVKHISLQLRLDELKDFNSKKKLTSAIRRITPNGLANNILFSFNGRSLRHIFEMRCSEHAEEEMQFVMRPLAKQMKVLFPSLLQDLNTETFTFENSKV